MRRFYFPGAQHEAALRVLKCITCQRNQGPPKPQKHTLISIQDGFPFQRISIDFVGPMRMSNYGNKYILTVKDTFTRWLEAFPTADMTAATVARILQKDIFARFGIPEVIHSDQGTQFTGNMLEAIYQELGIKRTNTPAYNPKSNPVERSHRDLNKLLRACVLDQPQDWEDYLPDCLLAIRTAKHRQIGISPYFALFGRDASLPLDIIYGLPPETTASNPVEYAQKLRKRLDTVFSQARLHLQASISRARRQYSNSVQGRPLAPGDLVWLFTPNLSTGGKKLSRLWTGPWQVTEELSPVLFQITTHGNWNRTSIQSVVSIDRLRRYSAQEEEHGTTTSDLQAADIELADEFLELPAPIIPPPTDHATFLPYATVPDTTPPSQTPDPPPTPTPDPGQSPPQTSTPVPEEDVNSPTDPNHEEEMKSPESPNTTEDQMMDSPLLPPVSDTSFGSNPIEDTEPVPAPRKSTRPKLPNYCSHCKQHNCEHITGKLYPSLTDSDESTDTKTSPTTTARQTGTTKKLRTRFFNLPTRDAKTPTVGIKRLTPPSTPTRRGPPTKRNLVRLLIEEPDYYPVPSKAPPPPKPSAPPWSDHE